MSVIKHFEPLNLYKTSEGNVVAKSAPASTELPKKKPDYIEALKALHHQFLVNIRTGGPTQNRAKEFLDSYPFTEKQRKHIEEEVFGVSKTFNKDENSLTNFKNLINNLYFPVDKDNIKKNKFLSQNSKHATLWTEKQWQTFKINEVFYHFIDKNFYPSLGECFTYEFHQKDGENIHTLKSVKMIHDKITPLIKDLSYNPKNESSFVLPSSQSASGSVPAKPWKWDNEEEYTRLKISGKYIHKMKHHPGAATTTTPTTTTTITSTTVFWVPIVLDDIAKTIQNCHYRNSSKQFDINNDYSNIIAVAGFNYSDKKINTSYVVDITDSSYLFYILSLIDETLNASLREVMKRQNETQLGNFKQVVIR